MTAIADIVLAGASGSGVIVGWSGSGKLMRADTLQALESAGLPSSWAPGSKSAAAHASAALMGLRNRGYVVRRQAKPDSADARWLVMRAQLQGGNVGDYAGRIALTVELTGDAMSVQGDDRSLIDAVTADYTMRLQCEQYSAGEVTAWLRRTLYRQCGATSLGIGYYVPAHGRFNATALCAAVSKVWGIAWIVPPLPVMTSPELQAGLARGFADDVAAIQRSFDNAPTELTAVNANKLMAQLERIHERVVAYRALCGDEAIMGPVAAMAALHAKLADIVTTDNGVALRFSLLELVPIVEQPKPDSTWARLDARVAAILPQPVAPEPMPEPALPVLGESSDRFSLLELD